MKLFNILLKFVTLAIVCEFELVVGDKFSPNLAYTSMINVFRLKEKPFVKGKRSTSFKKLTKETAPPPSTLLADELEDILFLPPNNFLSDLKEQRSNWMEEFANFEASMNKYGKKSKDFKNKHEQILLDLTHIMFGLEEPSFAEVNGFEEAFNNFEKMTFDKEYLQQIKNSISNKREYHDELSKKIIKQLNDGLIKLIIDYLDSVDRSSDKFKNKQDKLEKAFHQLFDNIEKHINECIKFAGFVMRTNQLSWERKNVEQNWFDKVTNFFSKLKIDDSKSSKSEGKRVSSSRQRRY